MTIATQYPPEVKTIFSAEDITKATEDLIEGIKKEREEAEKEKIN